MCQGRAGNTGSKYKRHPLHFALCVCVSARCCRAKRGGGRERNVNKQCERDFFAFQLINLSQFDAESQNKMRKCVFSRETLTDTSFLNLVNMLKHRAVLIATFVKKDLRILSLKSDNTARCVERGEAASKLK